MRYFVLTFYLFISYVSAHDYEKENIKVVHPVMKMVSSKSKNAAGYLEIINNSSNNIVLKKVEVDFAKITDIHEIINVDNVYKMRPLKNGLVINASEAVKLKPKSTHVMFIGLKKEYFDEEMLNARLVFTEDFFINIKFKVEIGSNTHSH